MYSGRCTLQHCHQIFQSQSCRLFQVVLGFRETIKKAPPANSSDIDFEETFRLSRKHIEQQENLAGNQISFGNTTNH